MFKNTIHFMCASMYYIKNIMQIPCVKTTLRRLKFERTPLIVNNNTLYALHNQIHNTLK
jgi:hypothetical protein